MTVQDLIDQKPDLLIPQAKKSGFFLIQKKKKNYLIIGERK